jgi:hypothetical protein
MFRAKPAMKERGAARGRTADALRNKWFNKLEVKEAL